MSPLPSDLAAGLELMLRKLLAWSLQLGLVVLASAGLARLLPLDRPQARMAFGQAPLMLGLALPLLQPWHPPTASARWTAGLVTAGPVLGATGPASGSDAAPVALWTTLAAAALAAAPFLREHHLRERVELLLKEDPMSRVRTSAHLAASMVVLVLAGTLAATAFPLLGPPTGTAGATRVATRATAGSDLHAQEEPAPAAGTKPGSVKPEAFPAKLVHRVQPTYPADAKEDPAIA